MVRYLIKKPVAVLMCFLALIITGVILTRKIPVSLLPDVDVPQIIVRVNYPNTSAAVIEQNIIQPIRENLARVNGLKDLETQSSNHAGILYLTFEYGTRMNLAYVEVNEKLDRLTNVLPRDMVRPQVVRINTSDIPVVRVQAIPKDPGKILEVTELSEKILKKRLEQVPGVSLVDLNGKQTGVIAITPNEESLRVLGLNNQSLAEVIRNANRDLGGISLKEGHYRYFVKMGTVLRELEDLQKLSIRLSNGMVIPLNKVAKIELIPEQQTGYHLFNGERGIVITVQKQKDSRMNELVPEIKAVVELFKKDYPQVHFAISQDQTFLLDAGISNLYQDLLFGGILTITLLFMFLGNWASPTVMAISIPVSLIITVIFFYVFRISFNIISLSGLALGIGMLIDNSIVVVDNITRKRRSGTDMLESSVQGTNEVMIPVISQVLTTVAVYAPLLLLSGMASALVYDQSIALTISLSVSLLVAFILAPLLYKMILKRSPEKLREDTIFYRWVSVRYHKMIDHILKYKIIYFLITVLAMPAGIWLATKLPVSGLPKIEKKESLVQVNWNAPIDAEENLRRILMMQKLIQPKCETTEAEVGIKQFILQQEDNIVQKSEMYLACTSEKVKFQVDRHIQQWIQSNFPDASLKIIDAPNAFTQLFTSSRPYFEARFKPHNTVDQQDDGYKPLYMLLTRLNVDFKPGPGMITEPGVFLELDTKSMEVYGVTRSSIENALQQLFGTFPVTEIKRFGEEKHIRLRSSRVDTEEKLASFVSGSDGELYPLRRFVRLNFDAHPKYITADRSGSYRSIVIEDKKNNIPTLEKEIAKLSVKEGFNVEFKGTYYDDREQLNTLYIAFFLVLFLIYFILCIQYENLILPILVMLTIPLGIAGGMLLLWLTGGTLDVMAAIGFIVVLGLIVDDPTLKIEVLTRLEKEYALRGVQYDEHLLKNMIHEAGEICLKPLLLVSLTTSMAMIPVLLVDGIGNDLQKPMAIVIIGGLTIGTFFTTWFIPLAYWYYIKWIKRKHIV